MIEGIFAALLLIVISPPLTLSVSIVVAGILFVILVGTLMTFLLTCVASIGCIKRRN